MLPWETIRLISEFCPLRSRYIFMQTCRDFSRTDWSPYCKYYKLLDRDQLKRLIRCDYSKDWCICRNGNRVWSRNIRGPLMVWTPWSCQWWSGPVATSLFLNEYRFVDFVREIGLRLKLTTPCIVRRNHMACVRVKAWERASMSCVLVMSRTKQRKIRRAWSKWFKKKSTRKIRALIDFRIVQEGLKIDVKRFEFLV